jgi:DeoR family transcriptional regulator of aga operon
VLPESFAGAVITHSLPVVQLLAAGRSKARLVALGGELCADRQAFVGPGAEAAVAGLRAKTYFLEPVALDEHGIYAASPAEASLQRRLIGIADEVVVIATSSVFNGSAPARIAPLTRVARLVVDRPVPERLEAVLRAAGLLSHTPCQVACPG